MSDASNEWVDAFSAREGLPARYAATVTVHLQTLADRATRLLREHARPVAIGINGGQGSGKSTLALFLVEWLRRESGLLIWYCLLTAMKKSGMNRRGRLWS